jgi:hypothetical protein
LAAVALGGFASPAAAGGAAAEALSVGYLAGSDELPGFDGLTWRPPFAGVDAQGPWSSPDPWEVVPAESLPLGDQQLAGATVEIRVHGLYPSLDRRWLEAADLDVLFAAPVELGADAMLPLYAWSLRHYGAAAGNPSPPNRFVLPVGIDGGLDLRLRVVPGRWLAEAVGRPAGLGGKGAAPAEEWRFATRFTVDWQEGVPRLLRGIYLLGMSPATWRRSDRLPLPGEPARPELVSLVLSVEPVADETP